MGAASEETGLVEQGETQAGLLSLIESLIDEGGDDEVWHYGSRTIQEVGTSTGTTIPKSDFREQFGVGPEDLEGDNVTVMGVGNRLILEFPEP